MSKEKELEELKGIIYKLLIKKIVGNKGQHEFFGEDIAREIQQAGYTKSSFPIGELKAWLEDWDVDLRDKWYKENLERNEKGVVLMAKRVLTKIQEIEDSNVS